MSVVTATSLYLTSKRGAFLHHMVRNLVGSLVYVGQGKHRPDWMAALLASGDRRLAAPTYSAAGLYLVEVKYEPRWGLPVSNDRILPDSLGL